MIKAYSKQTMEQLEIEEGDILYINWREDTEMLWYSLAQVTYISDEAVGTNEYVYFPHSDSGQAITGERYSVGNFQQHDVERAPEEEWLTAILEGQWIPKMLE